MECSFASTMDQSQIPKTLKTRVLETFKDVIIAVFIAVLIMLLLPYSSLPCVLVYAVSLICLAIVIFEFFVDWRYKGRIWLKGKAVVITGCDTGFGHSLALRLDDLGFQVFAGCLFPNGNGADALKKSASTRLHVLQLDVTKDEDIQNAVKYVNEKLKDNKLWAVVCNAGINSGGEVMWTEMKTIRKIFEINTFGTVKITKAFLPQICKSKGRVVAVASLTGRYSFMGMVPYCMSKHAIISFCDGLRLEMYRWGVQVITVEPYMYKTNFSNEANVMVYTKKEWENAPEDIKQFYPPNYFDFYVKSVIKFLNFSPSDKLNKVVACLEEAVTAKHPKYSYRPGSFVQTLALWFLQRFPKSLADFLLLNSITASLNEQDNN